jgi:phage terminase large subunit-like protein
MQWSTACPDWSEKLVRRESIIPAPLFEREATSALAVFDELRIVDAPGSPTMRDACRPWLRDFAASIFGSYDAETGRRLITEYLLLISKKNAKSTGAAAIMLTALIRNWRRSGEFGILAPTIEIANNSFWPARDMVRADDELREMIHVQEHTRTLTHRVTGATLKVVAADNESVGGKKWIGTLIDELWLFGKRPNAENMLREAIGGLASRPEGFVIYLSTQSDEPPAGVFRQKLHYARGVRDGRIADRHFLPVLYEFPKSLLDERAERDPANFYVTNPNIGASVDAQFLVRELQKAEESGEESLRGFLAKHLNVEIGLALQSDRWVGADFWQAQARPLCLDQIIERSDVLTMGIDGGGLDDLLGVTVIGRDAESRDWLSWSRAWAHPTVLERRKSEASRFRDFENDGDLSLVRQIGEDVIEVAQIAARLNDSGKLDKIGVDPQGIGAIVDAMISEGVEQDKIIGISQGWKLTSAIKTVERKLAEGGLYHCGRPMMAWCVGNARVEPRGNAVIITKQAAGFAKIDPLMALFNAAALMALNPAGGASLDSIINFPISA